MKTMKKVCLAILITLTCSMLVALATTTVEAAATAGADKELAKKNQEFEAFAHNKVQQLNDNYKFSRSRMQVVKQGDGTYLARFHQIDDASVKFKVSRSASKTAPYVAVLSYRERVYESQSNTPSGFDGAFNVVKIIPNRHIFSYQKGVWK